MSDMYVILLNYNPGLNIKRIKEKGNKRKRDNQKKEGEKWL